MSFYRNLPNDRPRTWFDEFRAEIISDHTQLVARRDALATAKGDGQWSFETALEHTCAFYRDRVGGYRSVNSITADECDQLLDLVASMGRDDFLKKVDRSS